MKVETYVNVRGKTIPLEEEAGYIEVNSKPIRNF